MTPFKILLVYKLTDTRHVYSATVHVFLFSSFLATKLRFMICQIKADMKYNPYSGENEASKLSKEKQ